MIKFDYSKISAFVSAEEIENMKSITENAAKTLTEGTGAGNDFLGWIKLPENYDKEEFARIKACAEKKLVRNFTAKVARLIHHNRRFYYIELHTITSHINLYVKKHKKITHRSTSLCVAFSFQFCLRTILYSSYSTK